ncbi:MAG: glycosyltransferase family 2 protein [Bacteroidetes bacterium]|nr:glycosyltransferase family 2 protein [Rhodothermia bacterium]MCS7156077.1 glycosyltransferase family 2 protein [Bacteroidota bacterium]MCX7907765.1 glycosyltransferase family 2 protein [Bacteroidota bacterium]MDW8137894.1 glycosyltransferase family 2 protein [Bacteroidota bacterium]MDW8286255.1 glycosyltransferase family 2 protein [Bacteroidota bacterium]
MRPRVSLAMITRNEEAHLPEALRSVEGVVDEIVIVDTGSTDRTLEIARAFGARLLSVPWEDHFARARNAALAHITGDWLLWMDADERLVPESRPFFDLLPERPERPVGLKVYLRNWDAERRFFDLSWAMRLVSVFPGLSFEGRVHEQVTMSVFRHGGLILDSPIALDHLGYGLSPERMRQKLERNYRLLCLQLQEEPDFAYAHLTMGLNRISAEDYPAAIEHLRRALVLRKGLDLSLELAARNRLALAYLLRGNIVLARRIARASIRRERAQCMPYLILGESHYKQGQLRLAYRCFRAALRYGPERSRAAYDVNPHRPPVYQMLLSLALRLGYHQEAHLYRERLYAAHPQRALVEQGYRSTVASGGPEALVLRAYEELLAYLASDSEADEILHPLLEQRRFATAARGYETALKRFPDSLLLRRRLAGLRVKLGDFEGARALLAPEGVGSRYPAQP